MKQHHVFSVRLPDDLYEGASNAAKRESTSLNSFVASSVREALRKLEEQRLYDAYSSIGSDKDLCEVEFALPAQAEVVLKNG